VPTYKALRYGMHLQEIHKFTCHQTCYKSYTYHCSPAAQYSRSLRDGQAELTNWRWLFLASDDEATVQEMKRLCDKITEMQNQRQMLEQQFRDELLKDDLTAALVTQGDKNQEVWALHVVLWHNWGGQLPLRLRKTPSPKYLIATNFCYFSCQLVQALLVTT